MLKNVGARYVILGHSENRQTGEDNQKINSKIISSLKSGLKIIYCIGETLKEKRNKKTNQVLSKQIKIGFKINSKQIRYNNCLRTSLVHWYRINSKAKRLDKIKFHLLKKIR